ncbi:hypothetical protein PYCCODRAFT_1344326, partial [Trametes coccinea BRFM310]
MNPAPLREPGMSSMLRGLDSLLIQNITCPTQDRSALQSLTRPFTAQEIGDVKARIDASNSGGARGPDNVSYKDVLAIPNDDLRASDPEGYRNIGLESCLLKTLTLLVDRRLREWATDANLVPALQNGFQEGLRTDNNVFALRAAIEQSRSVNRTLWVASVDLANAFPSVDQNTLWAKLRDLGAGGPLYD